MLLFIENDIIRIEEATGEKQDERILWIDEGNIICFTINMYKDNALPMKRKISDLEQLHHEGLLTLMEDDPFSFIYQSEDHISEKNKTLRDERWKSIEEIVAKEPDIYMSEKRGALIQAAMDKTDKTKRLLYKYLTQLWQRGKVKNALLPDYRNSGGQGKLKEYTKKPGRPRKNPALITKGIVINDEIKRTFEVSIRRFYHKTNKNPLNKVYKDMLRTFFVEEHRYENGVKKPILKDKSELPSYRQFSYWYKENYQLEESKKKRKGRRKYELEDRPVLGTSVGDMYGPGTKFQIDATVADVYVVSSFNRNWIIGRPVIYVVIDVFSRMVTGLYVGLEGPSWLGAMMALANTASDKVSYCKQYGIEITKEEWDCHYLPQTLLADRGELEGYNIERLISAFNLKVENTPPYRGDWKGIVERHFRTIHDKVKPLLPGAVDLNARVRGDRDYRLDATLTIEEFTSIIIRTILYHNNHHWLKQYNRDEMMIEDDVPQIPRELWNWGIKNRSGKLRSYPEDIVKLHLLPTASARVTYKGIEFKKMRYSSEKAIKDGWFVEARDKSWKIPISYDPRNMEKIYLHNENGADYEVATLLDHQKKYQGKTIEEVEYFFNQEELDYQVHIVDKENQQAVDLDADIEHILKKAKKTLKNEKIEMSNNQKTKGIGANRSIEKEVKRKEEAFLLSDSNLEKQVDKQVNISNEVENTSSLQKQQGVTRIDLLRQKQREKRKHATKIR